MCSQVLKHTGVCAFLSIQNFHSLMSANWRHAFAVRSSINAHCHVTFCHICEHPQELSSDKSLKYGSTMHLHVFHVGEKLRRYYFSAPFIELLGFQYCIKYHFSNFVFLGLLDYSKWLDYWSTFCNDTISIKHDVIYLMSLTVLNRENDTVIGP